jgi:ketosteroid isomerase-like protein
MRPTRVLSTLLTLTTLFFGGISALVAQPADVREAARRAVSQVLDDFHAAAAAADEARYFGHLLDHSIFLGTDATERWDKAQFLAFAHPYFSQGKGWTFVPRDRHVDFAANGTVAWFDELLDSATYGECRGTGVLEKTASGWKILQYHLTIPIPNDLADEVVGRIRAFESSAKAAARPTE